MKRKATIQKQAMIEALKSRYHVIEWDGGYNLYDTTKPARQTNCGDFVAQIYLNNDYSKYVYKFIIILLNRFLRPCDAK